MTTPLSGWGPILHTNFYTFTNQNFPFINHHWGSGVIFYFVHRLAGFTGISIFGLILNCATFLLCFGLAYRRGGFKVVALISFLVIPLLGYRVEIRPELFSYFFVMLFWLLLSEWKEGRLKNKWLWMIPLLECLWVNLHLYFFFGFAVCGIFWLEALLTKPRDTKKIKLLTIIFLLMMTASLINPSGFKGATYPLRILNNYGIGVQENQSVAAISKSNPGDRGLILFKIILASFLILGAVAFFKRRAALRRPDLLLAAGFAALAWLMVRNVTLFGFVALPTVTGLISLLLPAPSATQPSRALKRGAASEPAAQKPWGWAIAGGAAVIFILVLYWPRFPELWNTRDIGLMPGIPDAANFINQNHLAGPLFNDFDSGSYVTFYLYPRLRPFVDNRPEAFPTNFFKDTYLPMNTNKTAWEAAVKKYDLNLILYSLDSRAPYALPFIVTRLTDPAWAPVYADNYAIVFLKRNERNAALIKQFEIPKDKFSLEQG